MKNISMKRAVHDAVDFPLLLRIRERCVVEGTRTVFKKGQYVTILHCKEVTLIRGVDSKGRKFNMDKKIENDVVANVIVEEVRKNVESIKV